MSEDQTSNSLCEKMQVLRCTELPIVQGQRLFQRTNRLPAGHRFATTVRPATEAVLADHTKEEYQFLPRGRLPTYYFQKSLPRLPIPKLELTCQRYVEALTPLVSQDQLGKTENLAKNFEQGIGKQLHDELVQKDKELKETSYISGPWFEAYLKDRQPLPININPALVFVEDDSLDSLNASQRQLVRTTNLVVSSLRFMKSLDNETLSPEVFHLSPSKSDTPTYYRVMKFLPTAFATYGSYLFKAFPLDMSQYTSLFRSTRIPQKNIDRLKKSSRNVRHIVAIRRGNFYSVPVLDDKGNILPVDELKGSLESILNDESPAASHPVGVMTSQERNTWAEIREHMCQNDRNKQTLEEIDSALYVLGLDDEELGEDPNDVTRAFLYSDGSNRWFDKSFTLISSKDGWAGLNFEHAWGDGVAVMRFFNEVHKDSTSNLWSNSIKSKKPFMSPVKLAFELDGKSKQAIEDAQKRLNEHAGRLQIHPFIFEKYGRRECKAWGVGPDCIMQLGFQVVHHRLFGCTDTTYESCSTSAFRHGRTEAIRPATTLTKQVGEIMSRPDWKNQKKELQELIRKCSDKHNELTKNAAMGQGFDRHLFAMRILAEQGSGKLPDIYNDESYAKINHNVLSTSTLSSPAVRIGAFGPVVADGYGLAYQIWEGGLGSLITTYKGGKDGEAFANTCHQVFEDFGEIFQ